MCALLSPHQELPAHFLQVNINPDAAGRNHPWKNLPCFNTWKNDLIDSSRQIICRTHWCQKVLTLIPATQGKPGRAPESPGQCGLHRAPQWHGKGASRTATRVLIVPAEGQQGQCRVSPAGPTTLWPSRKGWELGSGTGTGQSWQLDTAAWGTAPSWGRRSSLCQAENGHPHGLWALSEQSQPLFVHLLVCTHISAPQQARAHPATRFIN